MRWKKNRRFRAAACLYAIVQNEKHDRNDDCFYHVDIVREKACPHAYLRWAKRARVFRGSVLAGFRFFRPCGIQNDRRPLQRATLYTTRCLKRVRQIHVSGRSPTRTVRQRLESSMYSCCTLIYTITRVILRFMTESAFFRTTSNTLQTETSDFYKYMYFYFLNSPSNDKRKSYPHIEYWFQWVILLTFIDYNFQ